MGGSQALDHSGQRHKGEKMSISKDFEKYQTFGGGFGYIYFAWRIEELLAHTRALEAMLKKHEWHGFDQDGADLTSIELSLIHI